MPHTTNIPRAGRFLAGAAAFALLAVAFHFGSGDLVAQTVARTIQPLGFSYRLGKVDEIFSRDEAITFKEIIPLGKDNVFIAAFNTRLVVYRVENSDGAARNIRLGEIPLLQPGYSAVDDIVILDDGASFLVVTGKGAAVWAVTKSAIYPASSP